jgi:hypothetical protein
MSLRDIDAPVILAASASTIFSNLADQGGNGQAPQVSQASGSDRDARNANHRLASNATGGDKGRWNERLCLSAFLRVHRRPILLVRGAAMEKFVQRNDVPALFVSSMARIGSHS